MTATGQPLKELSQVSEAEGFRLLYACESGSRAWGFADPDSDYDVRFIYSNPIEWYFTIIPSTNVYTDTTQGGIDIVGWEVRKALGLLRESNPQIIEWLGSGQVYMSNGQFYEAISGTIEHYYSRKRCMYHYLSMARNHYKDARKKGPKKYLYAIRSLLCCAWISVNDTPPPVRINDLLEARELHGPGLPHLVRVGIDDMVESKKVGTYMHISPYLSNFIETEIDLYESLVDLMPHQQTGDPGPLNDIFMKIVLGEI